MKSIQVKKGEILQKKGEYNPKIYTVKSGLLRSYSIDQKGKEHIFIFAPENWTVSDDIESEKPTELFIDALEDSTILVLDPKDVEAPADPSTLFRRIFVLQKRVIMLMSSSAIERYDHFLATYPDIVQRVPQKMIASYLGITPEALSKVKSTRR